VINPHKTVFVPLDFSVLYVRDIERLRRVFTLVPEYLRAIPSRRRKITWTTASSLAAGSGTESVGEFGGRSAAKGMVAFMREHLRLARLFGEWVKGSSDFELSAPISMGVICFAL